MALVHVDVELGDFAEEDLAEHVAGNDDLWAKCIAAREKEIARRQGAAFGQRAWSAAVRDGLIREVQHAR